MNGGWLAVVNNVELNWTGKKKFSAGLSYKFDVIEQFGEGDDYNLLYFSDNMKVLQTLYDKYANKFKLIYIDPPYNSDAIYYYQIKEVAFKDKFKLNEFIQHLYERIDLMKGLLNDKGFLIVHLDWHASHYIKVILDEIFGIDNFRNEIIVRANVKKYRKYTESVLKLFNTYQVLLLYSKKKDTKFKLTKRKSVTGGEWGELIRRSHYKPGSTFIYEIEGIELQGTERFWWSKEKTLKALKNYEIYKDIPEEEWPADLDFAKIQKNKNGRNMIYGYFKRREYVELDNNWMDIMYYGQKMHYPTEKNEALLRRIIELLTEENDLVGDFYCGSGTTLYVAEQMNRRWIGSDIAELAIELTKQRILNNKNYKPFKILKDG